MRACFPCGGFARPSLSCGQKASGNTLFSALAARGAYSKERCKYQNSVSTSGGTSHKWRTRRDFNLHYLCGEMNTLPPRSSQYLGVLTQAGGWTMHLANAPRGGGSRKNNHRRTKSQKRHPAAFRVDGCTTSSRPFSQLHGSFFGEK